MSWDDNRADKESLISEAWNVADTDDFQWGSGQMADLMTRWKNIGSAGRDDNERLWSEFQEARQHFFDRRDEAKQRRQEMWDENRSRKQSLVSEARSLSRSTDWQDTHQEIQSLRTEWKNIGSAGRDYDQSLWDDFNDACNTFYENRKRYYEERERERDNNASRKEGLVSEAKSLSRSTDWKETHESLKELRNRWKAIGPAGRDRDQELWDDFNDACNSFYENRKRFYDEREREWERNASRKASLVSEAQSLSRSTNWKETHSELQSLRNEWKTIGPAGREKDDQLWADFNKACNTFYDNRTRAMEKRDQERNEARRKKESVINRAKGLVNPSNWDSAHEEMKDLMQDWKMAGNAGKDDQELWAEFNRLRHNFFEHYKAWKAANRNQHLPEHVKQQKMIERGIRDVTGTERSKWGDPYVETGRGSRSTISEGGYTHSTYDKNKGRGKTTGHASGDFHKHGSHSHNPKKGHFERGNPPPAGRIISEVVKPPKK